ncbi:hypothetical protein R1sor_015215 [Riccia sorocarpa]|uniref:RING-type domain-containing protein n=1 Tax=Riccia sorocarpa TaxID=122646 RepID=A0ABD3HDG5_9MARC
MDVIVKAEPRRVGSSPEGGSSGVRDEEVLSGSQESSKKVEAPNAIVVEDWNEEDFILSIEYFAKHCNLPNEGMMPGDIPKTLVSDEDIEKCFGPRSGNKGRNGPKLNNCTGLPQSEVLHLFQVIDGHDKLVNGTLGAIFPRALYAERFLKKRINWAGYAQERHRNQLRSSKSRRESKPIGPPILRVHRVYKPPPNLSLEPGEIDERAPSPVDRNLKGASTIDAEQEAPAAAEEGISSEPSEVKPDVLLRGSSSGTSCLPVYVELKDDIAARENSIKAIHANISLESEALEVLRSSTKSAAESIALSVGTYKTDKEVLGKLETERTKLAARKQSLETRLEDGGFNEENPEVLLIEVDFDVSYIIVEDSHYTGREPPVTSFCGILNFNALTSHKGHETAADARVTRGRVGTTYSAALTALEESTKRLKDLQTDLKLSRTSAEKLNADITAAEVQIVTSQSALSREESTIEAQKEELNVLQPFAESKIAALNPTFVPTATEITKSIFRLSSCPVCSLGFHCMNFMPAPCGHAYHPACLVALVAKDGLKCIQCEESFHPHWCESWGINTTEEYRQKWEHNTELQKQRDAFSECIKRLYIQTPHLLSERRKVEKEKRQCLNVKYTATGVERTWRVSDTATKVRDASPSSTIISSREEEKDSDLCMTEVDHLPLTRSKKGKRKGVEKADLSRKVRTRSYVTEAEMSTGIGSPCAYKKVVLRPLGEIETPEAMKRTGALPSSKKTKRILML